MRLAGKYGDAVLQVDDDEGGLRSRVVTGTVSLSVGL
jgi:hypothetical protein